MYKFRKFGVITSLMFVLVLLSGCGVKYEVDDDGKRIVNEETGAGIVTNLIDEDVRAIDAIKNGDIFNGVLIIPLSKAITFLGELFGSFGLAIIISTLIVRFATLPITLKSSVQQKKMRELQPQIDKINRKYEGKTDRDSAMRKQQETMELYRKNNINLFGGCLGILVTFPLFIAFYAAIYRTPGIYVDEFFGLNLGITINYGIKEITALYIIPLIVVFLLQLGSTYLMQSSQKASTVERPNDRPNPMQTQMKVMMYLMPVMIAFFSFNLPYAMSVYFMSGSIASIVQAFITKKVK